MTDYGLGAIPSPPDPNDRPLPLDTAAPLPRAWVIGRDNVPRISMTGHLNQRDTPMCGGYMGATIKRYQEKVDGHGVLPFDAPWLYWHSRARAGLPPSVEGTYARAVLDTLRHEGIPIIGHPSSAPSFRIAAYAAVPFTADSFKRALIQYQSPVVVGMAWPGNWQLRTSWHPPGGVAPAPGAIVGGHLISGIGYNDDVAGGSVLLYNTWGDLWAGRGNLWAPYRFLFPLIHDLWKALDA